MKPDKKIPSVIGVLLLLISTFSAVYLSSRSTSFFSKASGNCDPDNLQVTNLTDVSFDLFFITSDSCQSNLIINSKTFFNLRLLSPSDKSTMHYFSITDLSPATNYTYTILSGGRKYQLSSSNVVTRSRQTSALPASNLAWGKVLTSDRVPAFAAVIFINIPGAAPISSLSNSQGYWNVPLASSFDSQGNGWFQPPPNLNEDIIVFFPEVESTQITANTSRNNPLPDIILGQNSDFSILDQPFAEPTGVGNLGLGKTSPSQPSSLSINFPKPNDSVPNSPVPEFFGTTDSAVTLTLMLDSQTFTVTPISGKWQWSPPMLLTLGNHRLTLTSPISTKSVNFNVTAASDFPAFTASASATPTYYSPSPTTILVTPSPEPTQNLIIPTVRQTQPSTESGVPVTGNSTYIIYLGLISFAAVSLSYRLWSRHD